MIIVRLDPFILDPGDTHLSTIWQIAEGTPDFSNIVAETQEDTNNLLVKLFNVEAVPERTYYGRARIVSEEAGLSVWSNVDIELAKSIDDSISQNQEPNRYNPPVFDLPFMAEQFDHTLFNIKILQPNFSSDQSVKSTTWMIREDTGKLVYISEHDEDNLFEIFIDSLLKENRAYRFEAMFHFVNNDNTMIGSTLVYTSKSRITSFKPETLNGDGTHSGTYNNHLDTLSVELNLPPDAVSSVIEVYKDDELIDTVNDSVYIYEHPVYDSHGTITVRAKSIVPNQDQEEWIYRTFIKLNAGSGFPLTLPNAMGE